MGPSPIAKTFCNTSNCDCPNPPRLLGRLKDWWINLGEYRQLQALQSVNIKTFLTHIHNEFVGAQFYHTDQQRKEYLQMKCCSFQKKDLEKHYSNMSSRFYAINGIDDTNLKQAYLNSLPDPLGNETAKLLTTKNLSVATASLGELYQNALLALEKFYNNPNFSNRLKPWARKLALHAKILASPSNAKAKNFTIASPLKSPTSRNILPIRNPLFPAGNS